MILPTPSPIRCPVCSEPLMLQDNMIACQNGHPFNIAREGYANLLLSHQRKAKQPGDDPEMVMARRRFFDSGAFDVLTEAVTELPTIGNDDNAVLDCGCGEGHLLGTLSEKYRGFFCGIDISKKAIQVASKRWKNAAWFVANGMRNIPVATNSMDSILSILAPRNNDEFHRILKPDGVLIIGVPGFNHLIELRKQLQFSSGDFKEKADTAAEKCAPLFEEANRIAVSGKVALNREQITDLIRMTPIFWRSSDAAKAAVMQLSSLTVTVSFTLLRMTKK
ncbi:putative RNA methyltransferase [Pontiella agarivorans]|uniref:Methyltransferase domain-containing protein n=1 Tax=Pontiella agarivorans TaxID=3038953 RepID=A0ABU5N0M9_9BACT|nr:methyltransferase domain-containing protein [Pontiella agarivorans]MDZ8119992.1 methyltransferase domain-containing protein [Pontiella agarivorans]